MKTPQFELFHEDIYSALRTCVGAIGGSKEVGVALWGQSQPADKQGDKLCNCLNAGHAQKLSLEELLWILRAAHDVGCHAAVNFICRQSSYQDPQPVEPEDEMAALQRQFISAVSDLETLASRITSAERTSVK